MDVHNVGVIQKSEEENLSRFFSSPVHGLVSAFKMNKFSMKEIKIHSVSRCFKGYLFRS